jgi:hypothetical protein
MNAQRMPFFALLLRTLSILKEKPGLISNLSIQIV